MRRLVCLLPFLVALSAFAAPQAGDYAFFEGHTQVSGDVVNFEMRLEAGASGYLNLVKTLNVGGKVYTQTERELEAPLLYSDSFGAWMVAECEDMGLRKQMVTVGAKSIPACFNGVSPQILYGPVPFSILSYVGPIELLPTSMYETESSFAPITQAVALKLVEFASGP